MNEATCDALLLASEVSPEDKWAANEEADEEMRYEMGELRKAFQKANGCVVDGEITAKATTWKKLLKLA